MSKALFGSKAAWKIAYVAFSALVVLLAVVVFARLQADAAAPSVGFERTDNTVTVNLTPSSSDELKFLRDSDNAQYWDWGFVDDADDCDSNGFVASEIALRDGTDDAVTLAVAAQGVTVSSDKHLCLEVLYGGRSSQTFRTSYAHYIFDVTRPEIEVGQAGLSLEASSDDPSGIEAWHSYSETSEITDCSSFADDYVAEAPASGNDYYAVSLTAGQNDDWYCFRADDTQGNTGYSAPVQVDTVAPELTVDQPAESSMVTLSVSQDDDVNAMLETNDDIDVDSWQYVQTSRTCVDVTTGWRNLDGLTSDIDQDEAVISFSRSHVNRTYCFRVADEAGNHAHAQHKVGAINEPPSITRLYQNRQEVIATASDRQYLNDSSWQYAATEDKDCHSGVGGWRGLSSAGFSSDAANNRATLEIGEANIDESRRDKWLCFRVSDNIADNYGYRSLNVDADAPTINLTQDNAVLRATAPTSDGAASSSWGYVSYTRDFDCDANAFELYSPIRGGSRANLSRSHVGDYFCFRAADRHDNYGYSETYRVDSLDTIAPGLKVEQDNKHLIVAGASGETIDPDTWGYAGGYSTQQTCKDIDAAVYDEIEDQRVELSESDVGDYFCVRGADESENYGYYSIRIKAVDATAPYVGVDRLSNNVLEASTDTTDADEDSWQYAVIADRADRFDCNDEDADSLSFNTASADNDRVILRESDNDKYYCFRVADKAGNHGYGLSEHLFDIEAAPEITVRQTDDYDLEVSTDASDVDGLTWGWADFATDPGDCSKASYDDISNSQITRNTSSITITGIASSQNGKYYCFRVADTSDDQTPNYGYVKHQYDLTPPTIYFEFAAGVLTAVADDDDLDPQSWHYSHYNAPVDCETVVIDKPLPQRKLRLDAGDNGTYFCFRVDDQNGNTDYARYDVSDIGGTPEIEFDHTTTAIVATSPDDVDPLSWRYALAQSEPFCGANHGLTLIKNSGGLNKVDLTRISRSYNWACFQVESRTGVEGFAKIAIDRQAPDLQIQQNNVRLTIWSDASDLDPLSWSWFKSDQDPGSCQSHDPAAYNKLASSSRRFDFNLATTDSGKYFCFRVADEVGNEAFRKTMVGQLSSRAPVIRFGDLQGNVLTARANNVDANSWQYARSKNDLNCSDKGNLSFNRASADNSRLSLSAADAGYWYCFRVQGDNGVHGYAKILVNAIDTSKPRVDATQRGNTVLATANESDVSWHYVVVATASGCEAAAFEDDSQVGRGNQVDVSSADDGSIYCFRATDKADNAGFDSIMADVEDQTAGVKDGSTTTTDSSSATSTTTGAGQDADADDDGVVDPGPAVDPIAADDTADDKDAEGDDEEDEEDEEEGGINVGWLIAGGAVLLTIVIALVWAVSRDKKNKDFGGSDNDIEYS